MVSETPSRRERGQLVLIAAVLVAASILGAVVLLNTIHASPGISAQTDAQSVSDAERVHEQIQSEVRSLFMGMNSVDGERLPYAKEAELEGTVEAYGEEFTQLAATNSSVIASVEYRDGLYGNVSYGDQIPEVEDDRAVIESAERLLRIYVRLESGENTEIEIYQSEPDDEEDYTDVTPAFVIEIGDDEVAYGPDGDLEVCEVSETGEREIELIDGAGEIRGDDGFCGDVTVFEDGELTDDVHVRFSESAAGEFEISTDGPVNDDSEAVEQVSGIINPEFTISYQDPNIDLDSSYTLYERAET